MQSKRLNKETKKIFFNIFYIKMSFNYVNSPMSHFSRKNEHFSVNMFDCNEREEKDEYLLVPSPAQHIQLNISPFSLNIVNCAHDASECLLISNVHISYQSDYSIKKNGMTHISRASVYGKSRQNIDD